jgi:hypothetical protein
MFRAEQMILESSKPIPHEKALSLVESRDDRLQRSEDRQLRHAERKEAVVEVATQAYVNPTDIDKIRGKAVQKLIEDGLKQAGIECGSMFEILSEPLEPYYNALGAGITKSLKMSPGFIGDVKESINDTTEAMRESIQSIFGFSTPEDSLAAEDRPMLRPLLGQTNADE